MLFAQLFDVVVYIKHLRFLFEDLYDLVKQVHIIVLPRTCFTTYFVLITV